MHENLRQHIPANIGKCWRCGSELTTEHIKGSKRYPEIICSNCGFIMEITSKANRNVGYAFIIGILTFATGYLVALIWF